MTATVTSPVPSTSGPTVVTAGVTRSFDGRAVLEGIDLAIRPGEFVALLGRSELAGHV